MGDFIIHFDENKLNEYKKILDTVDFNYKQLKESLNMKF